jgi:hypothetical protein
MAIADIAEVRSVFIKRGEDRKPEASQSSAAKEASEPGENCLAGLEAQFYALKEAMKALTG